MLLQLFSPIRNCTIWNSAQFVIYVYVKLYNNAYKCLIYYFFFNDRALQTTYRRVFIRVRRGVIPYPRIRESVIGEAAIGGGASVSRLYVLRLLNDNCGILLVEISYLRGTCGANRWDDASNESMYERCGMRGRDSGVGCGVVEWVKRSTLRWFGHIERMVNEEFVKVYLSCVEGPNRRVRQLGRWEDRVKEYVSEREVRGNGLEWARRECMDKERWRFVCRDYPLGMLPERVRYRTY